MDAYTFKAELWCEPCIEEARRHLRAPEDIDDESSYDSDDYPKGPFHAGGGEADFPQHCIRCGVFLKNPLTPDGRKWLRECAIAEIGDHAEKMNKEEILIALRARGNLLIIQHIEHYGWDG